MDKIKYDQDSMRMKKAGKVIKKINAKYNI